MKAAMTIMYVVLCTLALMLAKLGVALVHNGPELGGVVLIMLAGYVLIMSTLGFRNGCARVRTA
jgi:uncharacterized membrane protein